MWYYIENQKKVGPLDEEKMKELARSSIIQKKTMVWTKGMPGWAEAHTTSLVEYFQKERPVEKMIASAPTAPILTPNPHKEVKAGKSNPGKRKLLYILVGVLSSIVVVLGLYLSIMWMQINKGVKEAVTEIARNDGNKTQHIYRDAQGNLVSSDARAPFNFDTNDPKELIEIGSYYYSKKDYSNAVMYITKAADQGDMTAEFLLGTFYYNSVGVKQDLSKGDSLLIASAKQGYIKAKTYLDEIDKKQSSDLKNYLSQNFEENKQDLFNCIHPIGTAKSVTIHEVAIKRKNEYPGYDSDSLLGFSVRFTLYWEGPITKDGYTKINLIYDAETKRYSSPQILDTNGVKNEEVNNAIINFGAGVLQEVFEKKLEQMTQ